MTKRAIQNYFLSSAGFQGAVVFKLLEFAPYVIKINNYFGNGVYTFE